MKQKTMMSCSSELFARIPHWFDAKIVNTDQCYGIQAKPPKVLIWYSLTKHALACVMIHGLAGCPQIIGSVNMVRGEIMSLNDRFVWRSDDGMMLIFGRIEPSFNKYQFKCSIYLEYIMHTMNTRDLRKLIKLIVWACEDPEVILKALRIIEDAFTITIKLSRSAPKNMKYLQEVKQKYELR